LEELRRLETAATPGPWDYGTGYSADGERQSTTKADKAEFLSLSLNDTGSPLWLVDNTDVIPAVTGDGPNAKANAEFIAAARNQLPRILDALDAVTALADKWDEAFEKNPREPFEYGMHLAGSDIRAAITKALEGEN
jgi:hypothetical protein